jgi:dienelactone hydrolase
MRTLWPMLALLSCGPALAAETKVTFPSAVSGEVIPATFITPNGTGPFPAIVIVHDCSGLGPNSSHAPDRWQKELVPQGYAVLLPDSFSPRGLPAGVCTEPAQRGRVADPYIRAADAYGALAWLRARPDIDGRHIGIMGGSHGGSTTLATMYEPAVANNPLIAAKRDGYTAGIALYPGCAAQFGTWATTRANGNLGPVVSYAGVYKPIAPLLILIGEKDDWTPAEPCIRLVETSRRNGYDVDIRVYPGAHHSFDSFAQLRFDPLRNNANNPSGKGASVGGDAASWADAKKQVAAFFGRHIKGQP